MANIVILSPVDSDAAILGVSSAVSTLPAGNLQNMQPKRKWRSSGLAEYITVDFGAGGAACNGLALVGHNLTGAATLRLRELRSVSTPLAQPLDRDAPTPVRCSAADELLSAAWRVQRGVPLTTV